MKQGTFIVEFVQVNDSVLYFVRTVNGQIVKFCNDVSYLSDFFVENDSKILGSDSNEAS